MASGEPARDSSRALASDSTVKPRDAPALDPTIDPVGVRRWSLSADCGTDEAPALEAEGVGDGDRVKNKLCCLRLRSAGESLSACTFLSACAFLGGIRSSEVSERASRATSFAFPFVGRPATTSQEFGRETKLKDKWCVRARVPFVL